MSLRQLDLFIVSSTRGFIPPTEYTVTNVTGSDQDISTYCVQFASPVAASSSLYIEACHANPIHQTRGGRAEVGFHTEAVTSAAVILHPLSRTSFAHYEHYDVVIDAAITSQGGCDFFQLYFAVQDVDTTPFPRLPANAHWTEKKAKLEAERGKTHADGAGPKWTLALDTSMLLTRLILHASAARWVALPFTHPDPKIDPGVPIEQRQQHRPGWYNFRTDMSSARAKEILGGKISGTKWWPILGKYAENGFPDKRDRNFKGNPATRSGQQLEHIVAISYMAYHGQGVRVLECGSYEHPTIPDVTATPDGIVVDPSRKLASLPAWYRSSLGEFGPDFDPAKADFTRGIWECKTMLTKDSSDNGPLFKAEHLPQVYAEMICTGTYWAELTRYCAETKEIRCYRIYRRPALSKLFETVIARMRTDLLAGVAFEVACNHPDNMELIKQCEKHAAFYNSPPGPKETTGRFIPIPIAEGAIAQFNDMCAHFDTVAAKPIDEEEDTIQVKNEKALARKQAPPPQSQSPAASSATGKKKRTVARGGAAAAAKKVKAEPEVGEKKKTATTTAKKPRAKRERSPSAVLLKEETGGKKRSATVLQLWNDIFQTTEVIEECMANGDWEPILETKALERQLLRYAKMAVELTKLTLPLGPSLIGEEGVLPMELDVPAPDPRIFNADAGHYEKRHYEQQQPQDQEDEEEEEEYAQI